MNLRHSFGILAEKAVQLPQCFLWQVGMWLRLFRDLQGRRQKTKVYKEIRLLEWEKRHPLSMASVENFCTYYQLITITKLVLDVKMRGGLGIRYSSQWKWVAQWAWKHNDKEPKGM